MTTKVKKEETVTPKESTKPGAKVSKKEATPKVEKKVKNKIFMPKESQDIEVVKITDITYNVKSPKLTKDEKAQTKYTPLQIGATLKLDGTPSTKWVSNQFIVDHGVEKGAYLILGDNMGCISDEDLKEGFKEKK